MGRLVAHSSLIRHTATWVTLQWGQSTFVIGLLWNVCFWNIWQCPLVWRTTLYFSQRRSLISEVVDQFAKPTDWRLVRKILYRPCFRMERLEEKCLSQTTFHWEAALMDLRFYARGLHTGGGGSCPDTGTCKGIIKGTHAHRADHNDKVTTSKYDFRTHGIQVSVILCLLYEVNQRYAR